MPRKVEDPQVTEIMDRIAALPSLDEIEAKHPSTITREDRGAIVDHMRLQRALFEFKSEKRAEKKAEAAA